jgi:hypothetical protein
LREDIYKQDTRMSVSIIFETTNTILIKVSVGVHIKNFQTNYHRQWGMKYSKHMQRKYLYSIGKRGNHFPLPEFWLGRARGVFCLLYKYCEKVIQN